MDYVKTASKKIHALNRIVPVRSLSKKSIKHAFVKGTIQLLFTSLHVL